MGSGENPLTACSWWQTCSWGQTGFLAAVRGSPNVTFIEWNQSDLIIFWGADPLICPRASGLGGSSLKVTDRIQVTRIQFLNVSFWYLKKSYLRLKLESEDLGSNYDSAIDMLCDLEQVTSLGPSFPATLWRLMSLNYVKLLVYHLFSVNEGIDRNWARFDLLLQLTKIYPNSVIQNICSASLLALSHLRIWGRCVL